MTAACVGSGEPSGAPATRRDRSEEVRPFWPLRAAGGNQKPPAVGRVASMGVLQFTPGPFVALVVRGR